MSHARGRRIHSRLAKASHIRDPIPSSWFFGGATLAPQTTVTSELVADSTASVPADFLGSSWVHAEIDAVDLTTPGTSFTLEIWREETPGDWRLDGSCTGTTGTHHLQGRAGVTLQSPAPIGIGITPGEVDGTPYHVHAGKRVRARFTTDGTLRVKLLQALKD